MNSNNSKKGIFGLSFESFREDFWNAQEQVNVREYMGLGYSELEAAALVKDIIRMTREGTFANLLSFGLNEGACNDVKMCTVDGFDEDEIPTKKGRLR